MATCATCNKSFTFGGVKDGEVRYCSTACRFQQFMGRLAAALDHAAATEPQPLPAPAHGVQAGAPAPEAPRQAPESTPAIDTSKDLMVVLIGVGTSLLVAVVIYLLVDLIGYPFHAQMFWFVVPIGAFLCGMVAGGGFWLALRVLDRLPTAGTFLAAGVVGVLSYVLIYFLMWVLLNVEGVPVRERVGFGAFLQFVIEHQRIRMTHGAGEGFEVGKWGYVRFALSTAGFAAGVLATVAIGGGKAYCPDCKRYFRTVGKQTRASTDPEATGAALHPVIIALTTGRVQEALQLHGAFGMPGSKGYFTTTITVEACPSCGLHLATMRATVPGDQGVQEVASFAFQGRTHDAVRLFT